MSHLLGLLLDGSVSRKVDSRPRLLIRLKVPSERLPTDPRERPPLAKESLSFSDRRAGTIPKV